MFFKLLTKYFNPLNALKIFSHIIVLPLVTKAIQILKVKFENLILFKASH